MSYRFLLIALVAGLAACNNAAEDEGREVKQYSIEQLYKSVDSYYGGISSDDEDILVSSNQTGIFNVFGINLASGERTQLTNSTQESFFSNGFVPGTRNFIYNADKGGNENNHLFLQKEDGSVRELTPGENVKASFWGWNRAGDQFYYTSNRRTPMYFDLYKMDTVSWTGQLLYENNSGFEPDALSPDERYLALTQTIATSWTNLYLLDLQSGKLVAVNDTAKESRNSANAFSPDGKYLYYITDEGSEFTYAARYEIATGKKETVYTDKWDVSGQVISFNGKYRVVYVNVDGANKLHLFDHASGKELEFPGVEDGSILSASISRSEDKMILYVGSSRSPGNIFSYDFSSKELKQVTNALNPEIDKNDLVSAQVVRYQSFDGLEIPAIFYKPHQASNSKPVPAVVMVHGGPGGQAGQYYFPLIQHLVNKGYAILDVNNRGSSGYGKTFFKMDDRNHGDKDLKDVVWGKKYLASLPYIDSSKIGVMGGSYGGYMTLAALCFHPEEFKVGVDIFGVTNWLRTLREIPPYWESFRNALYREIGDPNTDDTVRLKAYSPLLNADKINKPLMVLQGANDARVLKVESDEIVEAVKKNNVPVDYVLFPDEGHGFMKKENEIKGYGQIGEFLDKYLKGEANSSGKQ